MLGKKKVLLIVQVVTAQNQSRRANLVKARIDKSQGDSLCRVCRKVDESIDHVVSGCAS